MKKFFTLIAAAAMLAVSCQNEITPEKGDSSNPVEGKLTATIVKTKVSYAETSEMNLQPAWEVGDKIIGFDDAGNTYTLTVASVSAETATLSGTVPDGALHLIYKSGAKASDISSKTLAIDYTAQKGDKSIPAVMLADGTVENGACDFAFANAGTIIGISAMKGVPTGATISKITVEGSNLSAATVALSGSALALTAATAASDAISTATLSGITTTDANGTLSAPVFIAVPAGAKIAKVSAALQARVPETMTIPSTAADKKDIDYVEIAAKYDGINVTTKKWAKWNVGANSEKDSGWYFAWGGTEGYVYKNYKWVSASGVDSYSYTLPSAKTANASDYLYVKTQSFAAAGHRFNWANTPFNNGSSDYDATYFSSVRNTVCPDNVLAKEYDAALANWREPWRMPTRKELQALYQACGGTGTEIRPPVALSSATPGKGIYWVSGTQSYISEYSGVAGLLFCDGTSKLFFPAVGDGNEGSLDHADGNPVWCGYWTSNLSSYANAAYFLSSNQYVANFAYYNMRYLGRTVRPDSDLNT